VLEMSVHFQYAGLATNMSGKMEINLVHNAILDTSGIKVGRSFHLLI